MILAATGHRPNKLGGYSPTAYDALTAFAWLYLRQFAGQADVQVISGMAQGWDTAWAAAAWRIGIPFTAAVPCEDQDRMWPAESRQRYALLIGRAARVVVVTPGGFAAWKMQKRNEWMVDHADGIIALWNGSPGGTANCVRYAQTRGKPIVNLWPEWAVRHP